MLGEIKIGIVEDELIIAEKIRHQLQTMGYLVCEPAGNFDAALSMIEQEKPEMLLIDINLKEKRDGIDLAKIINENYQLPFIFLTANSDAITIERAKQVKPSAYIVKPFSKEELYAAIEIAFSNYSTSKIQNSTASSPKDYIFIRENHRFIKLHFCDIVFAESRENYVVIHTHDGKNNIIRSTFSDFLEQLPEDKFYRTHRSFAIQIELVENVTSSEVVARGFKIPISNTYRAGLFTALGIKE